MSNDELALSIQSGNREQLLELWHQVDHLCFKILQRYDEQTQNNVAVSMEDLEQEAYLAMIEAVSRFKPDAGSFNTILAFYVRKRCRDALGLRGRVRHEHYISTSLDAPLQEGEGMTLGDTLEDESIPDASADLELEDLKRDVYGALERLPVQRKSIITQYDLQGRAIQAIADDMQLSRERVYSNRNDGLQQMRRDPNLQVYQRINFYRHKGITAFRQSGSSTVEDLVMQIENLRGSYQRRFDESRRGTREDQKDTQG